MTGLAQGLAALGIALAALVGPGPAIAQAAAPRPAPAPEPWTTLRETTVLPRAAETGRVKVNDVQLYYAIYGKGRPVLLLHPGLGHGDLWANQIGPLSQAYEVIVVDLRGHGRSTGSDRPLSYELLASDVLQLMQKLHVRKPAIIGWGDGATIGLEITMRHPKRISQMIAFGLTYDLSGQQPDAATKATFIEYVHKAAADYQSLSPQPERFDVTFKQLEALWIEGPRYSAEDLARVKAPVTVIAAGHDEWVRPEHMQAAAGLIPNARIVVLHRTSHFAPWQAPKLFNDTLRTLLKH